MVRPTKGFVVVLERLGFFDALEELINGGARNLFATVDDMLSKWGFPPAMIPFWSEGPIYTGYWKHWFSNRPGSFVLYKSESNKVVEIARTLEQFFTYLLIQFVSSEDEINADVVRFARSVGITDLEPFHDFPTDDLSEYLDLPCYLVDPPLAALNNYEAYTGHFPVPGDMLGWSNNACLYELKVFENQLGRRSEWPIWLQPSQNQEAFMNYLKNCDLREAWLTVNSPYWATDAKIDALRKIAGVAKDQHFSELISAWSEQAIL